ncbi:MAG: shikimate dehydrogenase [Micromonosporaceae bacterium]
MDAVTHRAGVFGKPIGHSLSPVIHNAGYVAAGLAGWRYTAHECGEDELSDRLAMLDSTWAGLSLTMPLKQVALTLADEVSPLAATVGAANTLYRRAGRWIAENTDAPGMVDVLRQSGVTGAGRVTVLGAGGTARAAIAAAARLGTAEVVVYARRREAIERLSPVAGELGVRLVPADWSTAPERAGQADVLISTVPSGVADALVPDLSVRGDLTVFDVLYQPWPTPLAAACLAAGCTVVGGLELLLAQAARQFELFTGVPVPASAICEAACAAATFRTADDRRTVHRDGSVDGMWSGS